MTYLLVQPPDIAVVIKDRAWYLRHLTAILDCKLEDDASPPRSFYLFDKK